MYTRTHIFLHSCGHMYMTAIMIFKSNTPILYNPHIDAYHASSVR